MIKSEVLGKNILSLSDLDIKGKRVFVRVDFNVPLRKVPLQENPSSFAWDVADSRRIEGALKTIEYILTHEGRCILASHLGRPKGQGGKVQKEEKYSLEPVAKKLVEYFPKNEVIFTEDCIGDGPRTLSHQLRPGEIMLLENLRFYPGEEKNASDFASQLFSLADLYVTDAFGTLHRAHASTFALPKAFLPHQKGVGFLVEKELSYLQPLKTNPERPFALVMGGAKVSDKMGILEQLLPKVDIVLIGGAMAYAFLRAKKHQVGKSLCEPEQVILAERILAVIAQRKISLLLPTDHTVVTNLSEDPNRATIIENVDLPENAIGVDLGPNTLARFSAALMGAETIFWNGPMGIFETPAFAKGSLGLAKAIALTTAKKLAGGGDSALAIERSGVEKSFDFVSTGGGATLEYLEGKELPGLVALV